MSRIELPRPAGWGIALRCDGSAPLSEQLAHALRGQVSRVNPVAARRAFRQNYPAKCSISWRVRIASVAEKNIMKWIATIANGLGILLAVSLLKNAAGFWGALAHARDFSDGSLTSGTLTCICGITALAIWVIVALFRTPSLRSLARATGLLLALFIPSYEWPEVAWKLEINASRYDELIRRNKSEPKLVILEEREMSAQL